MRWRFWIQTLNTSRTKEMAVAEYFPCLEELDLIPGTQLPWAPLGITPSIKLVVAPKPSQVWLKSNSNKKERSIPQHLKAWRLNVVISITQKLPQGSYQVISFWGGVRWGQVGWYLRLTLAPCLGILFVGPRELNGYWGSNLECKQVLNLLNYYTCTTDH